VISFATAVAAADALAARAARFDPAIGSELAAFQGKLVLVEMAGVDLAFCLFPGAAGLGLGTAYEGEPHAVIRGAPLALAGLLLGNEREDSLFSGDVSISGDIGLVNRLQKVLRGMGIDWEEHIAQFTGDFAARKLTRVGRALRAWGRDAHARLEQDMSEYLHDEARAVPTGGAVEQFMAGVDRLRSDVDRLEQRIRRLRKNAAQG